MPCPPDVPWTLYDYVRFIKNILNENSVSRCHIVAHSFGARVAVLLAKEMPELVDKMVITGGAGLLPRFNLWVWLKLKYNKYIKKLPGSCDYRDLTPAGKITFNNIIRRDLAYEIGRITNPTLLITGSKDTATPPYMAKRWAKLCLSAKYKIYKNAGHFAYLYDTARFIRDTEEFLNE